MRRLSPNALGLSFALVSVFFMIGLITLGPLGIYPGALDGMMYWHMFFSMKPVGIVLGIIECAVWGYATGFLGAVIYNWFSSLVLTESENDAIETSHRRPWFMAAMILGGLLLFVSGVFVQAQWSVIGSSDPTSVSTARGQTFERPGEVTLSYTWQNIGRKLVESGAIDVARLKKLYQRKGRSLTDHQLGFFTEGSNAPIKITRKNSQFVLNVLWALGITNKNPLLQQGRMGRLVHSGRAQKLASTGGWPLGTKSGGDLLNSAPIIKLTPEQQQRVETVATSTYRPCCNNPTSFPDCNHGAATLGLTQLLAGQGASTQEILGTLKKTNALWFPRQYRLLATYFREVQGREWASVDPQTVLDKRYSSAGGFKTVRTKLRQKGLLPGDRRERSAGCSV